MSFLKLNSHWLGLAGVTALSLGGTFFLFQAEQDLPAYLSSMQPRPVKPKPVPPLDISGLEKASQLIVAPGLWKADYSTQLFVSEPYLIENGQLTRPVDGSIHTHSKTRKPIPNTWFIEHKLPLFSSRIALEDTDGDGFLNEEEWLARTDPGDPKSHPPLVTKLQYTRQNVINNRVHFLQYLGNSAKPETLRLTVRLDDLPGKPQYDLKLGDSIPGTDFALKGFEPRRQPDPSGTFSLDASILALVEKKSNRVEKAPLHQVANFTDRTLYFRLLYPKIDREFSAKPGDKIVLDETEAYELIDASATSASVKSSTGTVLEISSTPQ